MIDRMLNETKDKYIQNGLVLKRKGLNFYCNDAFALLVISYMAFDEAAKNSVESALPEGDKFDAKKHKEKIEKTYIEMTLINMFDMLRFYELTFIKRFFALDLLSNIRKENNFTLEEYNGFKSDLISLKMRYDEHTIFNSQGSSRELYKDLFS